MWAEWNLLLRRIMGVPQVDANRGSVVMLKHLREATRIKTSVRRATALEFLRQ
jgi:hypothetical protein